MIKEKKIILFLFLAFILTIFLLKIDAYAVNELTNEELVTAKNNGIVSAMCYVQNLMTGAVAKSIMALSVLGVGWLFLLGGASWVTVLTFTVATSLVFGGVELANIISGNNLSCQSILKAEEEFNETVYNKGLCGINKIEIYKTGQTWLACVKEDNTENIDSCPKMIDNNTSIEEKLDTQNQIFRTVVLSKCQEGYLKKDNNIYLEYNCNKDKNGIGYFTDSKNNKKNIDKGSCKLACKESSLNSVYRGYNLIPVMDTNEKIKILNGRLENGYYPQDTELQVQCASGFVTYFDEGKDLKETCFGENCKNKNKFSLKCAPNGLFKPNINCKQSCSYDPYKDIDNNVKEWGRYKNNEYKPFDQNNKIFIEGDRVIIKNCKSGYMLAKGEGGLIGECRESLWWWNLGGSKCKITCKKSTLNKSVSFNGDSWFGCDDSKYCKKDISETEEFALGDSIVASGKCEGGYSISGSGENFLKYTCAQNGSWESNGGKSCKLNCKISDTNNGLPGIKDTEEWKLLSSNNKEDIKNGEKVQAVKCKEGYNVYPDNPTIYVCENGKFLYYGGPYEEYCKKGCKFEELKYLSYAGVPNNYDLTNSTKTWVECNESGLPTIRTIEEKDKEGNINYKNVYKTIVSLENTKEANLFARSGSYYRIEECRDGYERVTEKEDDILVAKCSENKNSEKKVEWLITKFDWNACRIAPKCYEFHVDADYSSKEITIGSNKIGSTDYSYYGNSSINVKMQLWGAPGGSNDDVKKNIGGYSKGILLLKPKESNRTLYITVGSSGIPGKTKSGGRNTGLGGFNGGGDGGLAIIEKDNMCQMSNGSGGGGATDIRYGGKLLDNRILVAGGGGGESGWIKENGLIIIGYKGGGEFGDGDESKSPSKNGKGGKQEFSDSTSLLDPIYNSFVTSGVKGFGGHGTIYIKDKNCIAGGGGGGGGYYGGSGGAPGAGGGGSGYFNEKILIETSKDEKPKNLTTIVSTGPQNGGFARVCWGDWYKQNDPCDSNHEESTSYKNNAGFSGNRTKCILNEGKGFKTNNNIEECTNESLKEFMIKENLLIPEILNEKLPKKYYKGMTIRQECGEGYIAKDHKSSGRVTFKCEGNNSWKIDSRGCMKHGCQEFKFVGADEPFEIPDTVEEVKMQVWGGQGSIGEYNRASKKGGYSYGNMKINSSNKNLFVYVGSEGKNNLFWNNGSGNSGVGKNKGKFVGGGATDIRTIIENLTNITDSLNSRIIVAGGAGAGGYRPGGFGGGGNDAGGDGGSNSDANNKACAGLGGKQNVGGGKTNVGRTNWGPRYDGIFGSGGDSFGHLAGNINGTVVGSGGGSGWYGGGGGCNDSELGGGGGGSGHLSDKIISGTGGGISDNKEGDGFARICWGDHPACDDTTGKRNKACEMEEYSCNDTEIPSEYNIIIPTTGTTIPGTSKVFQCKSGYTGSVKFWCGRDKWIYFSGECKIAHGCYEFTATGKGKELDMSNVNFGGESIVKIQLWGARGGGKNPGLGGYSKGNFKLQNNKVLNIFVGGAPEGIKGGFNGGGYAGIGTSITGYGGGGATDIRYGGKLLGNRILVAGGGGGSSSGNESGGKGGGDNGGVGQYFVGGGSQTSGGVIDTKDGNHQITNVFSTIGVLGQGGHGSGFSVKGSGSGAGGGYYGGGGGDGSAGRISAYSAGGGSGYIGGVTEGQTTDASNGPSSGGFARICWGNWGEQINPCDSGNSGYTNNAGIGTNKTKCTVNPGVDSGEGGTLPTCSSDTLIAKMNEVHVQIPNNATKNNLPPKYYQGMAIRSTCKSGYSLVSGGLSYGRVELTCGSDGNWIVNGTCAITPTCYEFTATGKGKKLDISAINSNVTEVKIQLWGARGGGKNPGLGGYSKGNFKLQNNKVLYVFVGGTPKDKEGGFNGGGSGIKSNFGFGGGGATDIRISNTAPLTCDSSDPRILVAGGGGGYSDWYSSQGGRPGFSGGGLDADNKVDSSQWNGIGGGQTFNCIIPWDGAHNWCTTCGVKGIGGYGSNNGGGGGGGGWYGGSGGAPHGGGGGSGHIGEEITGGQTDKSNKPTDGGFVRICWGDWTGQNNPCDSEKSGYTNNAGIGTNKTKCIADATNLQDVVGSTTPSCSLASFNTKMDLENVNKPGGLQNIYYEGMYIRVGCKSGYSLVSGGIGGFRATCGSNGTWTVNGTCGVSPVCYEFTATGKGKKLDISAINSNVTEVKIQLWGARGGGNNPGLGGYSKGNFKLQNNKVLNIFIGGASEGIKGGFNGGGYGGVGTSSTGYGGGGATDIRYGGLALTNRIIVAGGGGSSSNNISGGKGGGDNGGGAQWHVGGGSQISGGVIDTVDKDFEKTNFFSTIGVLGQGGHGSGFLVKGSGSGAGGGYYGGGGGEGSEPGHVYSSGGGSGYIGGVTEGQTTDASNGPASGGFARICWGNWTNQINPCDSNYEESTSYTTNAGISSNTVKCITNPTNLQDVVGGTLPTCSSDTLIAKMNDAHVQIPNNATKNNLPPKYYQGMAIRSYCKSGYSLVSGGLSKGRVELTCGSDGTWTVNGKCSQQCNNNAPLNGYNVLVGTGQTNSGSTTKFTCAAGYTGSVTMKCSEGTWSYYGNEKCIITPGCYEFTEKSKGKKLDISIINNVVTEVKIQLWGAKGGGTTPGLGGYSKGNFKLLPDNKALNIFVGGTPKDKTGGFNGGGTGAGSSFGGGGATDIRYGGKLLDNRILVAGGGGGYSSWQRGKPGFSGGGLNGDSGLKTSWDGKGGGQTFNCVIPSDKNHNWPATCGVKGVGGYGSNNAGGGGGGGWYGGSGGGPHGGGGGSGHIGEEITGGQTDKSNKSTDGGFVRICWGDWTGQTNPCDSNYEESTSYTTNAGIGTNKTKCIADATNLQDIVGGTAPSCSLASFNTKMDSENVNKPSGLQNIYYEGMYIRVGCKSGYNLPIGFKPEFRATCEGNETWTVNGECEKKCDNSTPLNGYNVLAGTGQTNSGSNKEFTCASGYTGIITMECNNGNWSHSGETCKKDCTDPIDIKNGTWTPLSTNHGGTVTLSCNNRYTLSGSSTAECINGNWKYDGSCEPNPCNNNAPLNGHNVLAGTGQTNSGSTTKFTCAAGYTGSVTMECNLGSWIYSIGSCNKDCTLPENPTGGTWSGSTNHGGSINLDCNTGYTKSGSKTATCTNGSWTYDGNAVCVQGACKGKPSLATGSQFHFSGGSVIGHNGSFYQNGVLVDPTSSNISNVVSTNAAILDAKCADGYKEIDHSYVCKNGIWETVGSCIQDCTITQNPSGYGWWTTNGEDKLVVKDKIPYGTIIKQVCPSGYSYGSNRRTAKCNGAGKAWTDVNIGNVCFVPGGCIGKPNLVPGGKFYPDDGNIQSEGNFYINGVKSILNHTNINDKSFTAENNSKIDAWCDTNSYTEVSDGGTCTASDNCSMPYNWSGLVYYCKNGIWKTVGSCKKNCTNLISIDNGTWSATSTNHGNSVTLSCNSGYTISGSKTATCNNGIWTHDVSCKKNCTMPENPTGGTWSGSTNHGGSISLDCNTGYTKSGSKTATCTNGSWTYNGNAVCVQGGCKGKPNLVPGSFFSLLSNYGNYTPYAGQFYFNGLENKLEASDLESGDFIASDKSVIDAGCIEEKYTESETGSSCGSCRSDSYEAEWWRHYYYCYKGNWESVGSCMKNCTMPGAPANGYWSGLTNHGNTITQICNSGYTISGSKTATCNNGSWNYSGNGSCMKNCTMPGAPANGYWSGSTNHGNTITQICNSGYTISGSKTATCNNGSWTYGGNGSCMRNCSNPSKTGGCSNKFGAAHCEIYRDCKAESNVTIKHGETTRISCSKRTSNSCFLVGEKTVNFSVTMRCNNGGWEEVEGTSSCSLN